MASALASLRSRGAWRLAAGLAGAGSIAVLVGVMAPVATTGCSTHQCDGENVTFSGGRWIDQTHYETSDFDEDWIPYPGAVNLTVNFPPGGVAPGRGPLTVDAQIGTGLSPNGGADFQGGDDWTPASGEVTEAYFLSPTGFSVTNGTCAKFFARFVVTFPTPGFTLFGGTAADGSTLTDTWTWDGTSWTGQGSMDPHLGPEERTGASMVSLGGMTYVFAGLDPTGYPGGPGQPQGLTYLGDMWSFTGASWNQTYFPGATTVPNEPWPSARRDAALVSLGGALVVFGGHGEDTSGGVQPYPVIDLSDTWTWDGNQSDPWSLLQVDGPGGRSGAAAAVVGSSMVLFGGTAGGTALGDTWTFDGNAWTQVAGSGGSGAPAAPSARFHAAAVGITDSAGNPELLLFGGDTGTSKLGDTWLWDGSIWKQPGLTVAPPARAQASIGALNGTVVLFGGVDAGGNVLSDTWTWTSAGGWVKWVPTDPAAPSPTPRYGAAGSGP